jgi:hypothetical protein
VTDGGVWKPGQIISWTGKPAGKGPGIPIHSTVRAASLWDDVLISIVMTHLEMGHHARHRLQASLYKRGWTGKWDLVWQDFSFDSGIGAIDAQGRAAFINSNDQLLIVGPEAADSERPVRHVSIGITIQSYLMSAVADGFAIVEPLVTWLKPPALTLGPEESSQVRKPYDAQQLAWWKFRSTLDPETFSFSRTGIVIIDAHGRIAWRAEVPFRVLAPPIDAGPGRVALVGEGLGMLENRSLKWAISSPIRLYATSFADGTLAVSAGLELWIVTPDGRKSATFRIPGEEPITTPPAIAADSSIWFATTTGLYVAE